MGTSMWEQALGPSPHKVKKRKGTRMKGDSAFSRASIAITYGRCTFESKSEGGENKPTNSCYQTGRQF